MRAILILALVSGLLPAAATRADPAPALVLDTSFNAPLVSPAHDGMLDALYTELFRRLGLRAQIQQVAAERGLMNANNGIDDGEAARIAGIEGSYPNLVRVPEAVIQYQMTVFSRRPFAVDGVASLAPYDVGIVNGWKILERTITGSHSLQKLEDGRQLFTMLDRDRIDAAVIDRRQGLELVRSLGLRGIEARQPPLLQGDWFIYLNKKHAALVPRLAEELRKMKQDGSYRRILDGVQRRYAQ